MKRLVLVPYTFVLMNWAAVRALWCYLRDRQGDRIWSDRQHRTPERTLRTAE